MRATRVRVAASLAAAAVAAGMLAACSGSSGGTDPAVIVIGEPEALTGSEAVVGQALYNGAKLAADEVDASGGVAVAGKKYQVEIKTVDYASDPARAITAVQQLLTKDNVKFILGPNISLAFAPAATLLARSKALVLSTATTLKPHLGTPGYENMFALAGTGNEAAVGEVHALRKALPDVKRVAMLLPGDDAGKSFQAYYGQAFKAAGISVVYNQTFPPASTDYTAQLTSIRGLHPDALLTGSFDTQAKPMVTQALQLGVTKTFIAAGAPSNAPGKAHASVPGFSYMWEIPGPVLSQDSDAGISAFKSSYSHYLGHAPNQPLDFLGTVTHDGVLALLKAMSQAGTTTDPARVAAQLTKVTSYAHSCIYLRFAADHTAQYTNSVGLISGGTTTYTTFVPRQG